MHTNQHLSNEGTPHQGSRHWRAFFHFIVIVLVGPLTVILLSTFGSIIAHAITGSLPAQSQAAFNTMVVARYLLIQLVLIGVLLYAWKKRPERLAPLVLFLVAIPATVFLAHIPVFESTIAFSALCCLATYIVLSSKQ